MGETAITGVLRHTRAFISLECLSSDAASANLV